MSLRESAAASDGLRAHRVVVVHHRYRQPGGEERYTAQLAELLGRRSGGAAFVERDSERVSNVRAARALARGGDGEPDVASAVAADAAGIVHAHNLYPTFGWRALAAAREAGAAVVMHLHNYRLYCAIGIAFRDGRDCDECAPRRMRNGVIHNCRGNPAEAVAYAVGLRRAQPRLRECVDLFVAPTRQLARDLEAAGLDLPVEVLPTWLPDGDFAANSLCGDGEYALLVGRVTRDKGVFTAIDAAALSGVPLRVAGDGPDLAEAVEHAAAIGAPVEFLGRLDGQALVAARLGAAFALLPSLWREVLPFAALESLASGLPLVVSDGGGLPDLTEPELVFARGDAGALATVMRRLFDDPAARAQAGERALLRAREQFSEDVYARRLAAVYDRARERRAA